MHSKLATVSFIGLGNMGFPMLQNLVQKGNFNKVKVFDLDQDKVRQAAELSDKVSVASNVIDVLNGSTHVLTMLPNDDTVKTTYAQMLNMIKSGNMSPTTVVDSSTVSPGLVKSLNLEIQAENGPGLIDAPVSGGVNGAKAGSLTFMLGGEESHKSRAKTELLGYMGTNFTDCGASGSGQVAKLCNNLLLAIHMAGVSEAMNLGMKLGIDKSTLLGVFNSSTGKCWTTDKYSPVPGTMDGVPSANEYSGGFGTKLMFKDLGLALSAAKDSPEKVEFLLGEKVHDVYEELCKNPDLASKDFSVVFKSLSKST